LVGQLAAVYDGPEPPCRGAEAWRRGSEGEAMSASSLLWKLNRLRAMSGAEFAYRVRHAVQARLEQHLGWGLVSDASPRGASGAAWVSALPRAIDPAPYVEGAD